MSNKKDIQILRNLSKKYLDICNQEIQDERRDLWRKHNSLIRTRPLIYMRWLAAWHEAPESKLECEDPFYRQHENFLRQMIFQDTIGDDYIIEPWITQRASHITPPNGLWGVQIKHIPSPEPGGAWKFDPPLKKLEDFSKLVKPHHVIDEAATARNVARLEDAVGDILPVNVDRAPAYQVWHADISTDLAHLRGLEQAMWDMVDNPEWLHQLVSFMSEGVLTTHNEAEAAGDWRLCNHQNQAMPYAQELPDPKANSESVNRNQLWGYCASQEMAQVSPEMHDEFILRYQLPIMEKFGLVAYGCCEDLTYKIDILRKIPNLRRIAVTPWADVRKCAEQIGQDYVFSWRPSPAEMICSGFDPDHVRKVVRNAMEASKGCHVDITLKDVQTVQHHPENLREWVKIVREITDDYV
ncbi:TPA: hypothetical protein EYP66_11955 [Candidatus Poribacteria bacterium]|nr:hypothetical protein [Candidatus Poribacteria bacterium]